MTGEDAALLQAFEACTLPAAEFHHANHVRVAWLCLASGAPFEEAALRFCRGLRRYAASLGKPDRYHETITWAFLALVNERRLSCGAASFEDFARDPASAELFEPGLGALARRYDRDVLHSDLARRAFLLPVPRAAG